MQKALYHQLSDIEDRHWWHLYRRDLVGRLVRPQLPAEPLRRGLDIGCGTGGNLELLGSLCREPVGLDLSPLALELARKKRPAAHLVRGDANRLSGIFRPESFDLITVFNVLYHRWVRDDVDVLRQMHGLLRPGGFLVLTEPAFPILWRAHDEADEGKCRYTLGQIRGYLEEAGFHVQRETYFNSFAFVPALGLALSERLRGRPSASREATEGVGELDVPGPLVTRMVGWLTRAETQAILRYGRVPLGVTTLTVAARPAGS